MTMDGVLDTDKLPEVSMLLVNPFGGQHQQYQWQLEQMGILLVSSGLFVLACGTHPPLEVLLCKTAALKAPSAAVNS